MSDLDGRVGATELAPPRRTADCSSAPLIGTQRPVDNIGHRARRFADGSILVLTAAAGLLAAFDWDVPGRTLCAAVLVVLSPGWTLLRLIRAPIEVFTLVLASALSIAYAMLVTLVLATRLGWAWQASAVITAIGCIVGLTVVLLRPSDEADARSEVTVDAHVRRIPQPNQLARTAARRFVYGAIGLVVAVVGMFNTDIERIGSWGMIQAVPPYFFLGTASIVIGVLDNLRAKPRPSVAAAWVHIVALVVVFHGVVSFTQPNPRFPVAWLHVAFADHLANGGPLLQSSDARFSWPGFFTAAGYLERVAGTDTMLWALALTPMVVTVVSAAVVYDLGITLGLRRTRSTLAALIFVLTNWIAQDYFAPQAVAFLLVFVIVDLVLRNLTSTPSAPHRLSRWAGTTLAPVRPFGELGRTGTFVVVLGLSAALIISHQLSPVMLIAMLGGLAIVQRTSTYRLTLIIALAFAGWVSYAAESYWIGHADVLFGSVGDVSSIVSQNVGERSVSASETRQLVVRLRMLTMLATWFVAGACLLVLRRHNRLDRAFVVLLFAPFLPLVLQPYGGEGLLRTALFSLPAAAMLIASVDLSRFTIARPARYFVAAGLTVLTVSLVPLLMTTRYGNESYEMVTDDDLAVYEAMGEIIDEHDPTQSPPIHVFSFSQPAPLLIGRMAYYPSAQRLPRRPTRAAEVLREQLAATRDVYIVIAGSHVIEREQVDGFAPGWQDDYLAELGDLVSLEVVASTEQGSVLRVRSLTP